jgi:glycosyltransferase involved in cell wall biosynthesis
MVTQAVEANSPEEWDRIWSDPEQAKWRGEALREVYDRIESLVPRGARVIDLGGGVGILAKRLHSSGSNVEVWDHSWKAVKEVNDLQLGATYHPGEPSLIAVEIDLKHLSVGSASHGEVYVSTECLEHLSLDARARVYQRAAKAAGLLVSVPNNRLGPDEEPQHTIKWTAKEFLDELRQHFEHCRVEVFGGYLLGVCGKLARKETTLSVCTPACDEAADIERTLASFRGAADQLVVGIDPRSTDATEEIARQYADVVFTLEEPQGPPDDRMPKVHFAHIRNQCMERCTGDWIFMTEAHESLLEGQDQLLALDELPQGARVGFVWRTGDNQRWAFPWLVTNDPRARYRRGTHNELDFPTDWFCVRLPQIATLHKRSSETIERRKEQRKVQNRKALTEDWVLHGNDSSLLYLGSEWSQYDKDKAIQRLQEFLVVNRNNGAKRYHARLQAAKLLAQQGDRKEARATLIDASTDDWSRIDHWFYLGDLALEDERYEEALQFYRYAATRLNDPPFCVWWVDLTIYGYLTAQRLVECYAALGKLDDALEWAERVLGLLPEDSPPKATDEARENIERITKAIEK